MPESNNSPDLADSSVDANDGTVETATTPIWGPNAPRGARTVLSRIVKEGANVPLFLGQTLVNSLRDTGYNNTTSAVCEHIDNSVESGAKEIRVYFAEVGPKARRSIDVLILDDGIGMSPNVLKVACAFGGSMRFDNRSGIGRFGMGMKAAALSISQVMDVYSWQEHGAYYNMTLDVNAIGQDKSNVILLPDPQLVDTLPAEVSLLLTSPMAYPKNPSDNQELFCRDSAELREKLGASGTIVYMPKCDRLTHRTIRTLVDHATREMSRVYRRQLHAGLRLFINNRRIEPYDPTYHMECARHVRVAEEHGLQEKQSRLVNKWTIPIPSSEDAETTFDVDVRLFFLPIHEWDSLPKGVLKNDLKIFEIDGVSFMRRDREVDMKHIADLTGKRNSRASWWRIEVDFPGELDDAFGVAMTKQGVRPKSYALELIRKSIKDDLHAVRKAIDQRWSERATLDSAATLKEAEQRANEAEALQATLLPQPVVKTEEERKLLEDNTRLLASTLKRNDETDEQAFERVKSSRYVTTYTHNEDAAFYRVDFKLGKVILTINTAHPFYKKLYQPLSTVAKRSAEGKYGIAEEDDGIDATAFEECSEVLINLELFLLQLGRTQSEMCAADTSGDRERMFDTLRRQWSINLATQYAGS